jgi:phosphatidylinositol glycan class W
MGYTSYTPDMVKRLKEGFVSNLDGTTMREIAAMSAVLPAFVLLRQCWPAPGGSKSKNESSTGDNESSTGDNESSTGDKESTPNFWRSLALDFLVIVVPTVACLTILADWIYTILAFVCGLLFVVLNFQSHHPPLELLQWS